ncbi:MAG TPA: hypothetical protein VMT28_03455 [Terriglobales bacterium]|jgi:hypothetical protein|nr:hypothetical protein [Terriglobales bacterium]
MAQFTQLGLSGKPEGNASPKIAKQGKSKRTGAALAGAAFLAAMLTAFMLTGGCSKGSGNAGGTASIQPPVAAPVAATPAPPAATNQPTETKKPARKSSRQHKLAAYKNKDYGVSFRYPKYYNLKEGEDANLEWDGMGPVEMNFVQDGGTTLTAVELPRSMYPNTDFSSAFFNVSVNPALTAEQCGQFAWPQAASPEEEPLIPEKTKVGSTEFDEIQASAAAQTKQADAKYYHIFKNGMCYEFALGVETASSGDAADGIKPVDHELVFRKLNWILSTVKIQPVEVPQVAHAAPSVPADGNNQ